MFGIMFVTAFTASALIFKNEQSLFKQSLLDKGQSLSSYISKLAKDPLIMKDSIQLDAIVKEVNKDPEVAYAIIQDQGGKNLTSLYASLNYQIPNLKAITSALPKESEMTDIIAAIRKTGTTAEYSTPITIEEETIGKVTMGMSEHKIRQQIVKTIVFILALNLIMAFLLGATL